MSFRSEQIFRKFAGRKFYQHNPQITLVRTTPDECARLGVVLAEKLNLSTGPVTVLLPLRGGSVVSAPGGPFQDAAADAALYASLKGALRPDIEQRLIPSTWRELGAGLYGSAGPFSYRLYAVNGLNSEGYSAEGIREGSQEGSEATAENWAVTGRLDWAPVSGAFLGAAFFSGDSDQGRTTPSGEPFSGRTTLFDVHADWKWRGLWLRGLYVRTTVADADAINEANGLRGQDSVGRRQWGWYLQGGFDVLSLAAGARASLTPFARYERYDTQAKVPAGYARNSENDVKLLTAGVVFKPIDPIAIKVDWQQRRNAASTGVNQWNVGLGYLF